VDGVIHIVGVDDPAVRRRITMDGRAEKAALQGIPKDDFTVLLKHQPRVDRASVEWFDLQLSGHTHGGQIFPFHWLVRLAYPARTGLSQVGDETWLYVSRGTGTWGPPIRFLAPSELTVIELEPAPDPT
jgi:predicted MPP superfamily phosphohydrolase